MVWLAPLTGKVIAAHIAPEYLDNIVKIFLGNILRLLEYFETYHYVRTEYDVCNIFQILPKLANAQAMCF